MYYLLNLLRILLKVFTPSCLNIDDRDSLKEFKRLTEFYIVLFDLLIAFQSAELMVSTTQQSYTSVSKCEWMKN